MDTRSNSPADLPSDRLPSVARFLDEPEVAALLDSHPRPHVVGAIREVLAAHRDACRRGAPVPDRPGLVAETRARLRARDQDRLRPVINATGVILHTGLGRAVLPQTAVDALAGLNRCCNLQIDLATGRRGKRGAASEALLRELTGAEAALVVNNNAAATFLILSALCPGREVIVSRGQLIEIGGSYRLPDCVHRSGAVLVEVGTTNKTHRRDYEQAITDRTAALLRVNPSNYRVVGFTQEVGIRELVALRPRPEILVIDDLGCGALLDLTRLGLPAEPTVQASIAAGSDLVCFSGDKLIGGPQAGIIVGRADLVQAIRKHPLTRMLRVGKLTELALQETLRLFLDPARLVAANPTLAMLARGEPELRAAAEGLARAIAERAPAIRAAALPDASAVGGGALPATALPTWAVAVACTGLSAAKLSERLREAEPPIIARISEDRVLLDVRTLMPGEAGQVVAALAALAALDAAAGREHA